MFNIGMFRSHARRSRTRLLKAQAGIWGVLLLDLATPAVLAESFPVLIRVDAAKSQGDLKPIWRFFGADEPNYAYMQHGRRFLGELGALAPDQVFFRAHNLLTSGDGTPALKWGSTGAYRMFSRMGRQRLAVESDAAVPLDVITRRGVREQPDVSALASRGPHELTVPVWHYHDDDVSGPDAAVSLALSGLPFADGDAQLEHFRIDEEHSYAFRVWQRMGSPQQPSPEQYAALVRAGQLAALGPPEPVRAENGAALLTFTLPRRGVSLLVLEWGHPPTN